jgi:ABC-type sugar transport system substrate-binding protein
MPGSHKFLHLSALTLMLLSLLSCGGAHDSDEYYVFVSANLQVPYWKTAGTGFSNAAGQFKVRSDYMGPQNYHPKAERDAIDQAVQKKEPLARGCIGVHGDHGNTAGDSFINAVL